MNIPAILFLYAVCCCLTGCTSLKNSKTIDPSSVQHVKVMVQRDVWVRFTAFVNSSQTTYEIDLPDDGQNRKGAFADTAGRDRFIETATHLINSFENSEPPQSDPPLVGGYVYHIQVRTPRLEIEVPIKRDDAAKKTQLLLDELTKMLQEMLQRSGIDPLVSFMTKAQASPNSVFNTSSSAVVASMKAWEPWLQEA